MKRILMLSTGGTIASKESGQGLSPAITSEEILDHVPAVGGLCRVETLEQIYEITKGIKRDLRDPEE